MLPLGLLFKLLALGPLLILAGTIIRNTIRSQLAWLKYKTKLKGLPVGPGRNPLYNHLGSVFLGNNFCNNLVQLYRQDGAKTRWFLLGWRLAVATVDLDLMKAIILEEPSKHINRFRAADWTGSEFRFDNLIVARDEQWRRLRRAYAPALKSTKFKAPELMGDIESSIEKLVGAIESKLAAAPSVDEAGHFVDLPVHELIHRYSLNLVFSSFYKQHQLIDFEAQECHWTDVTDEVLGEAARNPFLRLGLLVPQTQPLWDWLSWHFQRTGVWRRQLMQFIEEQSRNALESRRKVAAGLASDYRRNMIDHVIDQYLDGRLTRNEYLNSTAFLLSAADVTSVDALVHTLYELATRPRVQDKLRASLLKEGAESTYLGWVLNESLRLLPPAPIGCSREISRDFKLASGQSLPAGTFVLMIPNVVHRLKEYWGEDADEFRPERWADTSHHHPMQYIPFGAGVRRCPGGEFALFEMRKCLGALLTRYEFFAQPDARVYDFDTPFLVFLNKHSKYVMQVRRVV